MSILEYINSPKDLKPLNIAQLTELAGEVRTAILNKVSHTGGHVGPNLGIVEATVALHYVFDSPTDKIVFDVSHQCYTHKILTGRKEAFLDERQMKKYSGYTNPAESEHDFFQVGHTSTSVSLACGLAKARDIRGENGNVIAVIGDGSLSGGEALEGLNNAAVISRNMIIVVNDNEMSIAENHGGLYQALRTLRATNGTAANNWFKAMGFDYRYVENGNNVADLVAAFQAVKDTDRPVVVHIHTQKGKGYRFAEENKEFWHHYTRAFNLDTGKPDIDFGGGPTFASMTAEYLMERVKKDPRIVVVNAGTPGAVGFGPSERAQIGENFVDVGIAEEHAVAMTSALAKGGCKPVYLCLSTFIQRTYDQLSQDLAINNNPAVIVVFYGSITAINDVTHMGLFDIPMIANIPNITYLTPSGVDEYRAMLDWGIDQNKGPVVIRVPMDWAAQPVPLSANYGIPKYEILSDGSEVAILGVGTFLSLARDVKMFLQDYGIRATLINPRMVSALDTKTLDSLKANHRLVLTLEDGALDGGFGEKIARYYGMDDMHVMCRGARKEFTDRICASDLRERYRLEPRTIAKDVVKALKK